MHYCFLLLIFSSLQFLFFLEVTLNFQYSFLSSILADDLASDFTENISTIRKAILFQHHIDTKLLAFLPSTLCFPSFNVPLWWINCPCCDPRPGPLMDTSEPISAWLPRGVVSKLLSFSHDPFLLHQILPIPILCLLWYHWYSNGNSSYPSLLNSNISRYWHIPLLHSTANSAKEFSILNDSAFNLYSHIHENEILTWKNVQFFIFCIFSPKTNSPKWTGII